MEGSAPVSSTPSSASSSPASSSTPSAPVNPGSSGGFNQSSKPAENVKSTPGESGGENSQATVQQQAAAKKWALKNGDKTLEIDSEDKLLAFAQKGYGLDKKVSELTRMQAQYEKAIEMALSDPDAFYKAMGKNPTEIYEQRLIEQMRREEAEKQLSPAQKQMMAEREQYQRQLKERETELSTYKQKEFEAQVQFHQQKLEQTIVQALGAENLPKNEHTVSRMAKLIDECEKFGYELTPQQMAQTVAEEIESEQVAVWGSMSGEQLLKKIPGKVLQNIQNALLERLRASRNQPPKDEAVSNPVFKASKTDPGEPDLTTRRDKPFLSPKEFEKQLFEKFK